MMVKALDKEGELVKLIRPNDVELIYTTERTGEVIILLVGEDSPTIRCHTITLSN